MTLRRKSSVFISQAILYCLTLLGGAYLAHALALNDAQRSIVFHGNDVLLKNKFDQIFKEGFECPADGSYPIGDCDQFYYICEGGVVSPGACPDNSVFDPEVSECVDSNVASCAPTTVGTTSTTPQGSIQCGEDGFYAFGNCLQSFYFCSDGVPFYELCPPGLVFVESLQTCKTPEEAGCAEPTTMSPTTSSTPSTTTSSTSSTTTSSTPSTTTSSTSSTTTSSPPTTTTTVPPQSCDRPDGLYAYGPCLNHYYLCFGGQLLDQVCPNDLVFDETVGECVEKGACSVVTTTTASPDTKCPNNATDGTNYPIAPGACSEYYYSCIQGEAYPKKCPSGYLFDENTQSCNLAANVPCNFPPFQCPNTSTNFYPTQPGACNSYYYTCYEGTAYLMQCPEGSLFDESIPACNVAANVSCNVNNTFKCPNDDFDFYPITPGECSAQYYTCLNGEAYLQECPSGSLFDESSDTCELAGNVSCMARRSTFTCPNNTTAFYPTAIGACISDYYACYVGKAYPQKCPSGRIFDEKTHSCQMAKDADCNRKLNK